MTITDSTGKELDKEPRGLKLRLGAVYRLAGQTMSEFMAELKLLTPKDEADFAEWFNAAGYPIR